MYSIGCSSFYGCRNWLIRKEHGKLVVYCPYGLDDLFSLTIRPVKRYFDKESYEARSKRWKAKWDKLNIIEW